MPRTAQSLSNSCSLAVAEPIGELLAVVGPNGSDAYRAGTLEVPHDPARVGRGLCLEDLDEYPPRRTVDGDEQVVL